MPCEWLFVLTDTNSVRRYVALHSKEAYRFGTIHEVMEEGSIASQNGIEGSLRFLTDDPGRQMIGSFHPLTDDDWYISFFGCSPHASESIADEPFLQDGHGIRYRSRVGGSRIYQHIIVSRLSFWFLGKFAGSLLRHGQKLSESAKPVPGVLSTLCIRNGE